MPKVVMNISQSVDNSGLTKRNPYKKIITKAKRAPNKRAGSTITLIIFILPREKEDLIYLR